MLDRLARWWYGPPPARRVVKVIAFNEGDPVHGFHEYLKWDPDQLYGVSWEAAVRALTGFPESRLEIRLVEGYRKRRVVLYPGEILDTDFPKSDRPLVISAKLVPVPGSGAVGMDVTRRIQKYLGNDLRSVHDMFPFDDAEDNATRFSHVRILNLALTVVDMSLALGRVSHCGRKEGVSLE